MAKESFRELRPSLGTPPSRCCRAASMHRSLTQTLTAPGANPLNKTEKSRGQDRYEIEVEKEINHMLRGPPHQDETRRGAFFWTVW